MPGRAHLVLLQVKGVKGHDCWPLHWLSTGRRRSSSTCLATSMVSSRSKSPSASSMESPLPQDTERHNSHRLPAQQQETSSSYSSKTSSICSNSHRWIYAVGVRVTDRCWRGTLIHISWVPACWVGIGCCKPANTHTHTNYPILLINTVCMHQ